MAALQVHCVLTRAIVVCADLECEWDVRNHSGIHPLRVRSSLRNEKGESNDESNTNRIHGTHGVSPWEAVWMTSSPK
jgi:hypothetical protein